MSYIFMIVMTWTLYYFENKHRCKYEKKGKYFSLVPRIQIERLWMRNSHTRFFSSLNNYKKSRKQFLLFSDFMKNIGHNLKKTLFQYLASTIFLFSLWSFCSLFLLHSEQSSRHLVKKLEVSFSGFEWRRIYLTHAQFNEAKNSFFQRW